jgi:hypothetical protein
MAERKAQSAANGGKEKKKSRFQQKLEEMQRMQQEMKKKKANGESMLAIHKWLNQVKDIKLNYSSMRLLISSTE